MASRELLSLFGLTRYTRQAVRRILPIVRPIASEA